MDSNQIFTTLVWLIQVTTAIVVLIYTFINKQEEYNQLKQRRLMNARQERRQRNRHNQ